MNPLLFVLLHTARTLAKLAGKVGLPKWNGQGKLDFHGLRTTFISLLFGQGTDIKTVRALARHRNLNTTTYIYGRLHDGRAVAAVALRGSSILKECKRPDSAPRSE